MSPLPGRPESRGEGAISARRIDFHLPEHLDPIILEGRPEESYILIGISLLLPYLEPYLIRTMREARKRVTDPALAADLDGFNAQEGQHYRQHILFNQAVRPAGVEVLTALEAEVSADYRRFSEERSLRWNLAHAEGFEAFTTAMARFTLESGWLWRTRRRGRAVEQIDCRGRTAPSTERLTSCAAVALAMTSTTRSSRFCGTHSVKTANYVVGPVSRVGDRAAPGLVISVAALALTVMGCGARSSLFDGESPPPSKPPTSVCAPAPVGAFSQRFGDDGTQVAQDLAVDHAGYPVLAGTYFGTPRGTTQFPTVRRSEPVTTSCVALATSSYSMCPSTSSPGSSSGRSAHSARDIRGAPRTSTIALWLMGRTIPHVRGACAHGASAPSTLL